MKRKLLALASPGRRRTVNEIRSLLEEHARSGLSLLAFARTHQLCYASLQRWRSTIPPIRAGIDASQSDESDAHRAHATPGFLAVRIKDSEPGGDFTLNWPCGRSLRIPAGFDPKRLRQLLEVLEGRP